MADPTFDRDRFALALTTRRLGRRLIARAVAESTNDVAWEALAQGTPHGTVVVADVQTRGRGRAGRTWHTAPGLGLALSVALHPGCDAREHGTLPLVAGLALAEALETLGAQGTSVPGTRLPGTSVSGARFRVRLKWPNDILIGDRKVSGLLCESRRRAGGGEAVVVGAGVNVSQSAGDFPPELARLATSLAIEGVATTRELVAAAFLNALEPLWSEHAEGGRERVLARWTDRADFWGREVTVRTPSGALTGVARALNQDGGLTLALADGREATVLAGDVEIGSSSGGIT